MLNIHRVEGTSLVYTDIASDIFVARDKVASWPEGVVYVVSGMGLSEKLRRDGDAVLRDSGGAWIPF